MHIVKSSDNIDCFLKRDTVIYTFYKPIIELKINVSPFQLNNIFECTFHFQDPKFAADLANRFKGKNLSDISLAICSATDMVNITYTNIICPDVETAKVSFLSLNL